MAGAGIHPFHQQWPPAAAAPPPPGAAASAAVPPPPPVPGAPGTAAADEVRTIFITGLPLDVKERELHNLLRWLPGFEASQVNFKGDQPTGFAHFATAHQAIAAKAALQVRVSLLSVAGERFWTDGVRLIVNLQDLVFDAETKSALHTEMAKKNLFVKRGGIPSVIVHLFSCCRVSSCIILEKFGLDRS